MHIGMLGPFEVRTDDGAVAEVPGPRLRGLLAALARFAEVTLEGRQASWSQLAEVTLAC